MTLQDLKKIMKKIILCLMLSAIYCTSFAQANEKKDDKITDPLDISKEMEQIDKYGVPTVKAVEELKAKADTLFQSKAWKEAAVAYEVYAKNANWLANLLSQCVEPYYSASYKDKEKISYSLLKPFIPLESKANEIKKNRNIAYVKIGLCYKNSGNVKNAVAYLHKGLDLLSIDEYGNWMAAKDAMLELLQFNTEVSK